MDRNIILSPLYCTLLPRILFISLFFSLSAAIQAQQYITYDINNGLPTNHVYQIEQDVDGFMWFATNMGVAKFDGKQFRIFTTRDGLPTNDIWRIEATDNHKLWFFAKSKKMGYILKDKVYSFPIEGGVTQQPRDFAIDKEKVSFLGEIDDALGTFSLVDNVWKPQSLTPRANYYKIVSKTIYLSEGQFLTVTEKKAIITADADTILFFKPAKGSLDIRYSFEKKAFKCWQFPHRGIFIMSNPSTFCIFNLNDSTAFLQHYFRNDGSIHTDLNFAEVQESENSLQISRKNEWVSLTPDYFVAEQRSFNLNKTAVHIFKDRSGNFWAASHEFGLYAFAKSVLDNRYSFAEKKIQTIDYINGQLFINVFDEGWYVFDKAHKEYKLVVPFEGKAYGMGYHKKFKTYYFYGNSNFWVGKDLGHITKIESVTINARLRGMIKDKAGAKSLIETETGYKGINLIYFTEHDSAFNVINNKEKFNDSWDYPIAKTMLIFKNTLFIGGDGLYKTYGYGKKPKTGQHPLLQVPINTIIPYNTNFMLVGTDGFGAYLYDGENTVIQLKGSEGFSINKIVIYKDDIWMATGKGVHQFRKYNNQYILVESILDEDGLKGNNVNTICIFNDTLYVGQDEGMIQIPLAENKYKKTLTPYFFEDANYNPDNKTYSIFYGENISLSFGVLGLVSQKYVRYFYKMNTDDAWVPTNVSTLVMSGQSPGNYTVQFKAVDQHGNTGTTQLTLIVKPLWYQTLWSKIMAGMLVLSTVVIATLLYRRRIENKKKAELMLSKTMSELELKALRSQMNPHFVFNSLNAIQYYIIKNKTELSEEYLAKFSKLVRMFFEYSKYDALSITQEADLLQRYLEIEKLRFENKLEYNVYIDPEIDADDITVPSMVFQPIVENAVNHGIFHKEGGGTVTVEFLMTGENEVTVRIDDDGVGYLAMTEINKKSYGNYKSRSSEVIKERIKIISENKMSQWKLHYNIVDKGTAGKGSGTTVSIKIKYNPLN